MDIQKAVEILKKYDKQKKDVGVTNLSELSELIELTNAIKVVTNTLQDFRIEGDFIYLNKEVYKKVERPKKVELDCNSYKVIEYRNDRIILRYTQMSEDKEVSYFEILENDSVEEVIEFWDNLHFIRNVIETSSAPEDIEIYKEYEEEIYSFLVKLKEENWI